MFKLHKQSESQLDSRHNDVRNLGFHEYPLDDELVFLILATWAILKFELMLKEALVLESLFVALVLLLVVWSSSVWAFEAAIEKGLGLVTDLTYVEGRVMKGIQEGEYKVI